MSEIVNQNEQLEMAAEAVGYLGIYSEVEGERQWLATHCQADEWNPRECLTDAAMLICLLGLLVEVDRTAAVVTAVIGVEHRVEHVVMVETYSETRSSESALMLAVTRAAAEIGRCKVKYASNDVITAIV